MLASKEVKQGVVTPAQFISNTLPTGNKLRTYAVLPNRDAPSKTRTFSCVVMADKLLATNHQQQASEETPQASFEALLEHNGLPFGAANHSVL